VVVCGIGEQTPMLRDGRVDLAFVHPARADLAGFDTELLLTQDQVAVLPRGHPLAGRTALVLATSTASRSRAGRAGTPGARRAARRCGTRGS
jgi:DNA-binding transcriptional LysR family regulator